MDTTTKFVFNVVNREKTFLVLAGEIYGYSDIEAFVQMLESRYPQETYDITFHTNEITIKSKQIPWQSIRESYEKTLYGL